MILLAVDVHQACVREGLLRKRLQQLLGIRDGSRPDNLDACTLSLHCKSVDSVDGHGIAELSQVVRDPSTLISLQVAFCVVVFVAEEENALAAVDACKILTCYSSHTSMKLQFLTKTIRSNT